MKNKNTVIYVLIAIIAIAAIFYFAKSKDTDEDVEVVATTTDTTVVTNPVPVKKPTVKPSATTTVATTNYAIGINERKLMGGIFVSPLHVTLDSRCPTDVKCIQAGTVDVNVLLQNGNISQNYILSVGKPLTFTGKQVTLVEVRPTRLSTKSITDADYTFVFTVK